MTTDQLTDGHQQRRGCKSCFEAGDDDCSLIEHTYVYPCTACTDAGVDCELIVPPEFKRVCVHCKKKRVACSYKVDGGRGVDACDCCKQSGLTCYAGPLRGTHSKRFQKTQSMNADAVPQVALASQIAGAPIIPAALRKTVPPQIQTPAPPRKYVSCNQCRGEGIRCTLKRDQTGPCRNCKLNEEACRFILIPPEGTVPCSCAVALKGKATSIAATTKKPISKILKDRNKRLKKTELKGKKKTAKGGSRTARVRRPPPPKPRSTNGIKHTIIHTSFAHPITFNHVPAPNGSSPCNWCSGPVFGLFGHGMRAVEVIPLPNGHGYEEIGNVPEGGGDDNDGRNEKEKSNINNRNGPRRQRDLRGHNQLGLERSKMCVDCTFARVRAMSCTAHEMKMLEDLDPRIFDVEEWDRSHAAWVAGDDKGASLLHESRWCSVCPEIAEYGCVAAQGEDDGYGYDNEDGDMKGSTACGKGCGFLLCENCKDFLGKIEKEKEFSHNNNALEMNVLDMLVRIVDADKLHYPVGARADASFLTTEGELNRRLEYDFGQDGDVDVESVDVKSEDGDEDEASLTLMEISDLVRSGG